MAPIWSIRPKWKWRFLQFLTDFFSKCLAIRNFDFLQVRKTTFHLHGQSRNVMRTLTITVKLRRIGIASIWLYFHLTKGQRHVWRNTLFNNISISRHAKYFIWLVHSNSINGKHAEEMSLMFKGFIKFWTYCLWPRTIYQIICVFFLLEFEFILQVLLHSLCLISSFFSFGFYFCKYKTYFCWLSGFTSLPSERSAWNRRPNYMVFQTYWISCINVCL